MSVPGSRKFDGDAIDFVTNKFTIKKIDGSSPVNILTGTGVPNIAAPLGSLFLRTDAGNLYVKTNTGNSDWSLYNLTTALTVHGNTNNFTVVPGGTFTIKGETGSNILVNADDGTDTVQVSLDAVTTSAGAGDSGKAVKLNGSGKLDNSFITFPAVVDEKVKVSANDTTSDYLLAKLAAGHGITLTELNNGSNEDAEIAADIAGDVGSVDRAIVVANGTTGDTIEACDITINVNNAIVGSDASINLTRSGVAANTTATFLNSTTDSGSKAIDAHQSATTGSSIAIDAKSDSSSVGAYAIRAEKDNVSATGPAIRAVSNSESGGSTIVALANGATGTQSAISATTSSSNNGSYGVTTNRLHVVNYIDIEDNSAPATPDANHGRIYFGTDNRLYLLDETGGSTDLSVQQSFSWSAAGGLNGGGDLGIHYGVAKFPAAASGTATVTPTAVNVFTLPTGAGFGTLGDAHVRFSWTSTNGGISVGNGSQVGAFLPFKRHGEKISVTCRLKVNLKNKFSRIELSLNDSGANSTSTGDLLPSMSDATWFEATLNDIDISSWSTFLRVGITAQGTTVAGNAGLTQLDIEGGRIQVWRI